MLNDARAMPWRFWEVYVLALLIMSTFGYAASQHVGWFLALLAILAALGILAALMIAFALGKVAAYRETIAARRSHPFEGPS